MIVVVGSPIGRLDDGVVAAGGMASHVALAAASSGRTVQLVGKTGDDPTADEVVLDLARGGVGHVALLRDAGRTTPLDAVHAGDDAADPVAEPTGGNRDQPDRDVRPALDAADVDLGLRYLTEFTVVVMAEPVGPEVVAIVADAARWGEARMILVIGAGEPVPDDLPGDVIVLEAPDADPDGAFASMVGALAARLDAGTEPGEAFRDSIDVDGWTVASDDAGEGRDPGPTPAAR